MFSTPVPVPKPLLPSPTPTEATWQLDELLADLGHTQSKVSLVPGAAGWGPWPSPRPHHPPSWQLAAAGKGAEVPTESSLDNMLDSLTRDLQELGIKAAPAGICAACRKPIASKVSPHCHPGTPGQPLELPSQPPCLLTGAHSPGQNLAPRALHLCPLREGAGQGALLRAGRAGVLRGGLSPGLLPALCLLRRPHPRGECVTPLATARPCQPPHLSFSCRKSSRPWSRPGTPSISSVPTAGRCLEMRVCPKEQVQGSCPIPGIP